MMKSIFKRNALIAVCYSIVLLGISFLFEKSDRPIIAIFLYCIVGGAHFMIMGILMAVNHFQQKTDKRNGYMASFAFIWVLILLGCIAEFYIT